MCREVVKLPKQSGTHAQYPYIHRMQRHGHSAIPVWNLRYKILAVAYHAGSAGMRLSGIIRTTRLFGREVGHENSFASSAGIYKALNALVGDGFLIMDRAVTGSAHSTIYTLNPQIKWLWRAIRDSLLRRHPRLSNQLRLSILGEHDFETSGVFHTTHIRLIRNVKIRVLREQGKTHREIAILFHVTKANIRAICSSDQLINSKMSKERFERHLEAM